MEKSRSKSSSKSRERNSKEDKVQFSHDLLVMGTPHKVQGEAGEKLADLLKKFAAKKKINLTDFSVMLDGEMVKSEGGDLSEDITLNKASIISLLKKVVGGRA